MASSRRGEGAAAPKSETMAALQIVAVVELLEQVLLQLPLKDLLRAQQVSKHFNSVITTSKELQRALFFVPDPPTHDTSGTARINPILSDPTFAGRLPLWFDV